MRSLSILSILALAACSTPVVSWQEGDQVGVQYHRTLSSPEAAQRVADAACGPGKHAVQRAMVRQVDTNDVGYVCRS